MSLTKEIRLVILRSLFDQMHETRRPNEPVVSYIREAIDHEVRRRRHPERRVARGDVSLGSFEDLRELIDDALEPDETAERFVRAAVAAALRARLAARVGRPAPTAPSRDVRLPTAAERAAALLEAMAARRAAREESAP